MLASAGPQPNGSQWVHEVKWDGMRVLGHTGNGRTRLISRTGRDISVAFPELLDLAGQLADGIIDGEIIALAGGLPSFETLAERIHVDNPRRAAELAQTTPVSVMAFDLLQVAETDLTGQAWQHRRDRLEALDLAGSGWSVAPVFDDGAGLAAAAADQGLEGTVSKRRRSTYQAGRRSKDWIKTPIRHHQACLVGGWRQQTGTSSKAIGALLVGIPGPDGLSYAGRVGSGLTRTTEQLIRHRLEGLVRPDSPFETEVPAIDAAGAVWVEPELVVEVRHLLITSGGRLRQPVFRGIRTDLSPEGVHRES